MGGILYGGGLAYQQTNTYINMERTEETEKIHRIPKSVDVAVFGSSHGRDALQSLEGAKSFFIFSMSSQTPQYDEKMLLQFSNHLEEDALIILTVSYANPYWVETEDYFLQKQPRYYRILDAKNIVNVDMIQYCFQRFSPLLTNDLTGVSSAFISDVPLKSAVSEVSQRQTSVDEMESERVCIQRDHVSVMTTYPEPVPIPWGAYCVHRFVCACRPHPVVHAYRTNGAAFPLRWCAVAVAATARFVYSVIPLRFLMVSPSIRIT